MTTENSKQVKFDCWSSDGERFDEDLSTILLEAEIGDTIYQAVSEIPKVIRYVDAQCILEQISERVYEEHGEYSEDYLLDVSKTHMEELEKIVADWLEEKYPPTFYRVSNITERLVTAEDKTPLI